MKKCPALSCPPHLEWGVPSDTTSDIRQMFFPCPGMQRPNKVPERRQRQLRPLAKQLPAISHCGCVRILTMNIHSECDCECECTRTACTGVDIYPTKKKKRKVFVGLFSRSQGVTQSANNIKQTSDSKIDFLPHPPVPQPHRGGYKVINMRACHVSCSVTCIYHII